MPRLLDGRGRRGERGDARARARRILLPQRPRQLDDALLAQRLRVERQQPVSNS